MPLLTKIITEDEQKVLLSDPVPEFDYQKTSKKSPPDHLGNDLKKQARKDKNYFYQLGEYHALSGCEIITYIRWNGMEIKQDD